MSCDPLVMDGRVVGTITRGPEMTIDHVVPDGVRWCFQCRKHVPFRYQVLIAADPAARLTYAGCDPIPRVVCEPSGHVNGDCGFGRTREWES